MIWWYRRKTRILRAKAGLPKLFDEDDLPDPKYDPNYVHVLTEKEQQELHYRERPASSFTYLAHSLRDRPTAVNEIADVVSTARHRNPPGT